ncbi:MAG: methyl-accepting chemotaxis protein [Bacillota bacterium]|nr:methyl-accepting chemotaxis protein [Bacillota bacterium]
MITARGYESIPVDIPEDPNQYTELDYMTVAVFSFHQLFKQNCVFAIADTQKYRVYIPGKEIDHKLKAGDLLIKGSVIEKAIQSKSRVSVRHDSSLFGFPYIGTAYPVFGQKGEVVGGIIYCENIKALEELTTAADNLNNVTEQVLQMVGSLEVSNNTLTDIGKTLAEQSIESMDNIKSTDEFLKLIKGISVQTNILGINAAIEAARAGEKGAGFSVVANEIRKLSDDSLQSVKTIAGTLKEIQNSSESVHAQVSGIGDFVEQQAAVVQQLSAVVQHLHSVAETLHNQAELMISN